MIISFPFLCFACVPIHGRLSALPQQAGTAARMGVWRQALAGCALACLLLGAGSILREGAVIDRAVSVTSVVSITLKGGSHHDGPGGRDDLPSRWGGSVKVRMMPRTSSREYNEMEGDKKYIVYSPSGGFNNQLICLLNAIYVAQRSGRAVLVPPFGRHSSQYFNYYKLTGEQVIPMDFVVDLDLLERLSGVPLIPLNMTLRELKEDRLGVVGKVSNDRVDLVPIPIEEHLRFTSPAKATAKAQVSSRSPKQVVMYYGAFFNRHWMTPTLRESVRLSPYIRSFAKSIARVISSEGFNAFHIRLGDKLEMARKFSSKDSRVYISASEKIGFNNSLPVYVATDERKTNEYMRPIIASFATVFFARDLKFHPGLKSWFDDFFQRFPPSQLRSDVLGLVEMLVCVRADKFVGTSLSTFTGTIVSSRHNLSISEPEIAAGTLDNGRARATAAILWNGQIQQLHYE